MVIINNKIWGGEIIRLIENLFGTYKGDFGFAKGEIYIGELNNNIHAEVSYNSIGIMHERAQIKNITEEYIELILDLNDVDYLIRLRCQDNHLIGNFNIAGHEIKVSFIKIKDSYKFSKTYSIIPKEYVNLLKENNSYEKRQPSVNINYELNNITVLKYLDEIGIKTKNNHDLSTIKELLRQFCLIIHQDGVNYTNCNENGTINEIKFALSQNSFTNCRGVAKIFSGILRAYGFKSSYVTCRPYDQMDFECHVVCEVYVEELKKFIFIDPSQQVYFIKDGKILNLIELRECIENNESVSYYEAASQNGNQFDLLGYLGYFSKNIFYFEKCIDNCEDKESVGNNVLAFVPKEYRKKVENKYEFISSNINDYYQ